VIQGYRYKCQAKKRPSIRVPVYLFIPESFQNFSTMVNARSYIFSFIRISVRASIEWLSAVPQKMELVRY
jgi:hypothetical protein